MKNFKIIMTFALALALVACGDDEPSGGSGGYGNDVPFPQLSANHKRISTLKREFSNGLIQTLTATYDSKNHLTGLKVDTEGPTSTSESITIDYSTLTIDYKQSIRSTTYEFTLDNAGRITHVGNPRSSAGDDVSYTYDNNGDLLMTQRTTTNFVNYTWFEHDLMRFTAKQLDREQQVSYTYSADTENPFLNKGSIDPIANIQSPFSVMMTMVMRSEGMMGNVSNRLPIGVSTKTQYTGQDLVSKSSAITYSLDSNGFVTAVSGYDNVNDLSYTLTITYAN